MRGFKRIVSLLIVICVMITCCSVNTNTAAAAAITVKKGSEISEIKINETTQKVTAKEISHKAGWYKKSGVQYYFNKNKTTASYKWENKTLYQWKNGSFKKYNGVCKLSDGKYYYFKKGKKTAYSVKSKKWKKDKKSGQQYFFYKNSKSASYLYDSNKKTVKKWNKSKKQYALCTGNVTLSDGKRYKFTNGKKDVTKVTPAKKHNDIPDPVNNLFKSGRPYGSSYNGDGSLRCHIDIYGYIYDSNGNYLGSNVYY
jgi:hypothetical protein